MPSFHAQEAQIIAQAGRPGAVTIATNMAGRGTDIKLGGNPEMSDEKWDVEKEKQQVLEAGGLFVLGTERHESRRLTTSCEAVPDARGDPGLSRFYLSLQDDLMRIFGFRQAGRYFEVHEDGKGESISARMLTKVLETAQKRVEGRNFEIRKNLLKFDDVMNDQRKIIYSQRLEIMDTDDVSEKIKDFRRTTIQDLVYAAIPARSYHEQWDLDSLGNELRRVFGMEIPVKEIAAEEGVGEKELLAKIEKLVDEEIANKQDKIDPVTMRSIEKQVLLVTLDQIWKEHLHSLDSVKQGIGLRAYGQKDPLNEYKHEAFRLFEYMLRSLAETVTELMAHIEIQAAPVDILEQRENEQQRGMKESHSFPGEEVSAPQGVVSGTVRNIDPENRNSRDPETWGKVARNEPCPCGSGLKYKQCHGKLA